MQLLIQHIQEQVSLSDEESHLISQTFTSKVLDKKEMLLFKGDVSNHMRFIEKGCLRAYNIDDAGNEHILQFGIEGWWVNDLFSCITQQPAQGFIQALEPSRILQIHRESLDELFKTVPVMERFFRLKIQSAYVALQERTIHSMSKTAEQRYLDFRNKYRNIEQRVPQYMVASYLGITPEHLSSLRKKLL
ncbi:Crp/Fnr family transcriptional regulator [Owenweeksia hongkongensis]|uniref:Crp/Fnr family transcriptional regulator n=1 Tax=Owenweeksia hongkongensis TaxID=253245 RepID=UPI003A92DED0